MKFEGNIAVENLHNRQTGDFFPKKTAAQEITPGQQFLYHVKDMSEFFTASEHCQIPVKAKIDQNLSAFAECGTFSVSGIQDTFTDTKACWCYLKKLILVDELDGLLKT